MSNDTKCVLLADTAEDTDYVYDCLHEESYIRTYRDGVIIDGFVTYDQMAKVVDYLRNKKINSYEQEKKQEPSYKDGREHNLRNAEEDSCV